MVPDQIAVIVRHNAIFVRWMGRKALPRAILAYQRADRQRPESEPLELGVNMKICVSICTMHNAVCSMKYEV